MPPYLSRDDLVHPKSMDCFICRFVIFLIDMFLGLLKKATWKSFFYLIERLTVQFVIIPVHKHSHKQQKGASSYTGLGGKAVSTLGATVLRPCF